MLSVRWLFFSRRLGPLPGGYIKQLLSRVEGWLSYHEALYLYALAAAGPAEGKIVEIGSWKGKSTVILAKGSKQGRREEVYAIDPHKGGPDQEAHGHKEVDSEMEFRDNVRQEQVADQVRPMVMRSDEAATGWSGPVRLLWIDGDHSYEAVKQDFLLWERFVAPGGVIAFHDTYAWEGPRRVVEEMVLVSRKFAVIGLVDSITAVKKLSGAEPLVLLRSYCLLFARYLYKLGRRHVLPGDLRKLFKAVMKWLSSVG